MNWRGWVPVESLKTRTNRTIENLSAVGEYLVETAVTLGGYKLLVILSEKLFPADSLKPIFGTTIKEVTGWLDGFVIFSILLYLVWEIVEFFWKPAIQRAIQGWRNGVKVLVVVA